MAVVLAALPWLLGRDFTPDNELRYLSIADEALRQGQWMAFTNHGVPYADKPPLYMWIVMLGRWLFGANCMAFLALFSLVPALCIPWIMRSMTGFYNNTAVWLTLTGAFFLGSSITLRMDMLMTLWIVIAMRSFMLIYRGEQVRQERWWFPLWLFLGVFTKGPLGLLFPLLGTLVLAALTREWRRWARAWGWRTWMVVVALCAAWWVGVAVDGGLDYLNDLLFKQTVGRSVNAFTHKEGWWYYLVTWWYTFAPWSLVAVAAVVVAACKKQISSNSQCLCLSMVMAGVVFLSCLSGKLQVYMLPLWPFMAWAAAMCLKPNIWVIIAIEIPALVFFAVPFVSNFIPVDKIQADLGGNLLTTMVLLGIGGALASVANWFRKVDKAVMWLSLGLLAAVFTIGLKVSVLNPVIGYGPITREAQRLAGDDGVIYTYSISRPENMDVYLGHPVVILNEPPSDSNPQISGERPAVFILRARHAAFIDSMAGSATEPSPYGKIVVTSLNP